MTVSITHCWRKARIDLVLLLLGACLAWALPSGARAQSVASEVTQFQLEGSSEGLLLSAAVTFELPPSIEDALLKGVSMFFVAQADVYRERWYWTDKKVASAERSMRLVYLPLSRRWRLNVSSGSLGTIRPAVALNQSFDTLNEAMAVIQRLSRWKIAETDEIEPDQPHTVVFNFRLDVTQLPRPLQIGALGQADWSISVTARKPYMRESSK